VQKGADDIEQGRENTDCYGATAQRYQRHRERQQRENDVQEDRREPSPRNDAPADPAEPRRRSDAQAAEPSKPRDAIAGDDPHRRRS
jgi:hypothetical protein